MKRSFRVILLSVLAASILGGCGDAQKPSQITLKQKEEFIELLGTLPTQGDFFAAEAVQKAKPYLPHLLSLTEEDTERFFRGDLYPLLALSVGMTEDAENLAYAAANFHEIGHPWNKLLWARAILDTEKPPLEVIEHVRNILQEAGQKGTIASTVSPGYLRYLEERLAELDAGGKQDRVNVPELDLSAPPTPAEHATCVQLVSRIDAIALPRYSPTFDYETEGCAFGTDDRLNCLRPAQFGGRLCVVNLHRNTMQETALPQPKGVKQKFSFDSYFSDPHLCINKDGDILAWWTVGGNGDHAVAVRPGGKNAFVVARTSQPRPIYMANSKALSAADGRWYMLVWNASPPQDLNVGIYRVTHAAALEPVGRYHGPGHHAINVLDAAVLDSSRIVLIWTDVDVNRNNRQRVWTVQFDLNSNQWSKRQMLARYSGFTSTSSSRILVLPDGNVHYLWHVEHDGESSSGIFYLVHGGKTPAKIAPCNSGFQAIQLDRSIIIAYSLGTVPSKVFFRVLQNGKPGPETSIDLQDQRGYPLSPEYMIMGSAGDDGIWLVHSSDKKAYLLKLATTDAPKSN